MANKTVNIAKAFTLNRDDGSSVTYGIGTHAMPEDDARHWFTALHAAETKAVEAKDEGGKGAAKK